jgi:hypothetical protein
MEYHIVTGLDVDNIRDIQRDIILNGWPEFMFHDPYVDKYWDEIMNRFQAFQFVMLEKDSDRVMAIGNSMPLIWDDYIGRLPEGGLDWALEHCHTHIDSAKQHITQCAFQIVIAKEFLGAGVSYIMVEQMIRIGKKNGMKRLIAPVRPNLKNLYPLIPIDNYINWKNDNGYPFDNWLRVHTKLGGEIVKVCHQSMIIEDTVDKWEKWTGLKFPESGQYVIPGALVPMEIDRKKNKGTYLEPNVWTVHDIN